MKRTAVIALVAGLMGGILLVLFGLADLPRAAFAYLTALVYWLSIVLGALLLLLLAGGAGVRWLAVPRRVIELTTTTLPALFLLFVPVLFLMPELYAWVTPEQVHAGELRHVLEHRAVYMNRAGFVIRAVVFFAVWIALAELLLYWSTESDAGPDPDLTRKQRRLGSVGLPLYALTITFASFDWVMSLEPAFYTTAFGVYFFAGGFLAGLATVVVLLRSASAYEPLRAVVSRSHFVSLGKLLLAFVVFWAYIAYTQFFIVWMGDLPEEVGWYAPRMSGGWRAVAVFLLVANFIVPFLLLLSRGLKERPGPLAALSAWLVVVHYVDVYWLIMPVLRRDGPVPHLLDLAALLFVGGVVIGVGALRAAGRELLARHDPHFTASVRYVAS